MVAHAASTVVTADATAAATSASAVVTGGVGVRRPRRHFLCDKAEEEHLKHDQTEGLLRCLKYEDNERDVDRVGTKGRRKNMATPISRDVNRSHNIRIRSQDAPRMWRQVGTD